MAPSNWLGARPIGSLAPGPRRFAWAPDDRAQSGRLALAAEANSPLARPPARPPAGRPEQASVISVIDCRPRARPGRTTGGAGPSQPASGPSPVHFWRRRARELIANSMRARDKLAGRWPIIDWPNSGQWPASGPNLIRRRGIWPRGRGGNNWAELTRSQLPPPPPLWAGSICGAQMDFWPLAAT